MTAIDLIVLGSLYQSAKSAYELQKQIEMRNLSRWVKIGSFTVYKKVLLYETKGWIVGETIKNGKMPQKKIYTLTSLGKEVFMEWMMKFSKFETRIFLDFNAVIVNLGLLDENDRDVCLQHIKSSIQQTNEQLREQASCNKMMSIYGQAILKQQTMLLETLSVWEHAFEEQLKEKEHE